MVGEFSFSMLVCVCVLDVDADVGWGGVVEESFIVNFTTYHLTFSVFICLVTSFEVCSYFGQIYPWRLCCPNFC